MVCCAQVAGVAQSPAWPLQRAYDSYGSCCRIISSLCLERFISSWCIATWIGIESFFFLAINALLLVFIALFLDSHGAADVGPKGLHVYDLSGGCCRRRGSRRRVARRRALLSPFESFRVARGRQTRQADSTQDSREFDSHTSDPRLSITEFVATRGQPRSCGPLVRLAVSRTLQRLHDFTFHYKQHTIDNFLSVLLNLTISVSSTQRQQSHSIVVEIVFFNLKKTI